MAIFNIFPSYIVWHYTEALNDMLRLWTNFIWFTYNFFSIPYLAKTLFSPWQRMQENKKSGFHAEDIAEVLMINLVMRLVGAVIRGIFIFIGMFCILIICWLGVAIFLAWLFLPALLIMSVVYSINLFI